MHKDKNKYFYTLSILFCLLRYQPLHSQDSASYENKILGRWVSYYGYRQDTIIYVPVNSPLAENISLELRYGGITFKTDSIYLQHVWKMCGNDDGPDFYPGKWSIAKSNKEPVLTISSFDKQLKSYFILEIASDKIVLVPTL